MIDDCCTYHDVTSDIKNSTLYEKEGKNVATGKAQKKATTSDFNLGKSDQSNLIQYYKLNLCQYNVWIKDSNN